MFEAYFDESERTGGTFAVAGYAFSPPQARKFTKEWRDLFGGQICRMAELTAKRGTFDGISNQERDRLIREAVKLINKRISFGVAISVNVSEINSLSPKWIQGFGHAYPVCCHFAMAGIGTALEKAEYADDVAYFFEAGHAYESEARRFLTHVTSKAGPLKAYYRHRSDTFAPKTDAVPLQAADMLAWEWTKCQDETIEQRMRPVRRSLRALVESNVSRYTVLHFTGPLLARYLRTVRDLGLSQLDEDEIRGKFPNVLPR